MSKSGDSGLLELLKKNPKGGDPWASLAAKAPAPDPEDGAPDAKLSEMLKRIHDLASDGAKAPAEVAPQAAADPDAESHRSCRCGWPRGIRSH